MTGGAFRLQGCLSKRGCEAKAGELGTPACHVISVIWENVTQPPSAGTKTVERGRAPGSPANRSQRRNFHNGSRTRTPDDDIRSSNSRDLIGESPIARQRTPKDPKIRPRDIVFDARFFTPICRPSKNTRSRRSCRSQ
jgi:hypothetical protein